MKTFLKNFPIILIGLILSCCGNNTSKFEEKFSGDELKAVKHTESSLPRGAKIVECNVVKDKLPLSLLDNEYKSIRDQVNKARLDYRTCLTRGLKEAAQKNMDSLSEIQEMLLEKSGNMEKTSPVYLFVMAQVKEKPTDGDKHFGYIAVYEPSSMKRVDLIQVTTPLYNNAIMMTEAIDGTLTNPEPPANPEDLQSSNPITAFILSCNPK